MHRVFKGIVALGFFAVVSPAAASQQWAREMFKETSHDFGMVANGSKTHFNFEFTNKYREDVHVSAVRSSCGCTTPTVTKDTLKAGETGSIVATFNTTAFSGAKTATLTVVFDQPYYAEVQLQVSGFIRTDVMFKPAEVAFGEVASGEEVEQEVKVTFSGRRDWEIEDVRSLCPHLRVRLEPPNRSGSSVEYTMRVGLKPTVPEGEIQERLTLVTNDPKMRSVVVSVTGRVRSRVEVKPEAVHLGAIPLGGAAGERLLLRADEPFEVVDVKCDDSRFSFDLPSGAKKVHFLKMSFAPGNRVTGNFKVPVRIQTNLATSNTAECVVTGDVVDR